MCHYYIVYRRAFVYRSIYILTLDLAHLGSSIRNNPVQNKLMNGEDPINNNHAQTAGLGVRLATSSSSRDPSPSDEDMDGEVEILGFKMPTEERVRKR